MVSNNMNNMSRGFYYIILVLLLILFFIPSVDAVVDYNINNYYQNTSIDLQVLCKLNNILCTPGTLCSMTLFYPDTTIFLNDSNMTRTDNYYYITINNTEIIGNYNGFAKCNDGNLTEVTKFNFNIVPLNPFTVNSCPDNSYIGAYAVAVVIILSLIFISFRYKMSIMGFISSLALLFIGYTLTGCQGMIGALIMVISISLILAFALFKWH